MQGSPGRFRISIVCVLAALACCAGRALAADWPTWRHDARRSAVTDERLPAELHLRWVRELPKLEPAWPDQRRMRFDVAYEPVVKGRTLFIASPRTGSVTAYDTASGAETWRFYADAPVRFAPVAWKDRLYFASDDGYLYCLKSGDGSLVWKFRGGRSDRKVLGNGRVISMWCARGGPVVADGRIYFAAGIWPMMGVFIYALDAETGGVVWENDSSAFMFMLQPHTSPAFAGVAPQGCLVAAGEKLLVPNGRAVPACFDRETGRLEYYHLAKYGKIGSHAVASNGTYYFSGGRFFDVDNGTGGLALTKDWKPYDDSVTPVMDDNVSYTVWQGRLRALKIEMGEVTDRLGTPYLAPVAEELWRIEAGDRVHLKAGPRLFTTDNESIMAVTVPEAEGEPEISWEAALEAEPHSVIAADGKLFVSTLNGTVLCFGGERFTSATYLNAPRLRPDVDDDAARRAADVLTRTGVTEGYCVAFGLTDGRLVEELARQSKLHVIAMDADAEKVDRVRRRLDATGLLGERVEILCADPRELELPPYLASLVVSEDLKSGGSVPESRLMEQVMTVLRPYGGVACLPVVRESHDTFARAMRELFAVETVTRKGDYTLVTREGALRGAGDWTHQYADAANTVVSKDERVRLPLGVLWFGGSTHENVLPRHGHGPSPQVVDGRLFIEGPDTMRAMDVYTGRVLWEVELPGLGQAYNQTWHQPGANAVGSNYASTSDGVYVAYGEKILRLDPSTGETMSEFTVPASAGAEERAPVGMVVVCGDVLVAVVSPMCFDWDPQFTRGDFWKFEDDPKTHKTILQIVNAWQGEPYLRREDAKDDLEFVMRNCNELLNEPSLAGRMPERILRVRGRSPEVRAIQEQIDAHLETRPADRKYDTTLRRLNRELLRELYPAIPGKERGEAGYFNWDHTAGRYLVVMDRRTGKELWRRRAVYAFRHNGICVGADKVFCIDRLPDGLLKIMGRRGETVPTDGGLTALDLRTGSTVWETRERVFGTWLGYAAKEDVLLESGRPSGDMLTDEPRTMAARRGSDGLVLWDGREFYSGPCMLHDGRVITATDAYDLRTGEPVKWANPLTGVSEDWGYRRMYGCNSPVASRNLVLFRSAAAGFYDLETWGGTGNFGGFRSGCTSNLIAAGGVLSAPDYTRTCTCSYQNQTSLALVHMPEVEVWTFNSFKVGEAPVRRLGINLGAPGDRRAKDGTLWLEYPFVGGPSPKVKVWSAPEDIDGFYRHSLRLVGEWPEGHKWVAASGARGLSELTVRLERGIEVLPWMPFGIRTRTYTVRLHFAEPDRVKPGERLFDVAVQGERVLTGFDVVKEAGGTDRVVIREFRGVRVRRDLKVTLTPTAGAKRAQTLLSGVEVIAEGW